MRLAVDDHASPAVADNLDVGGVDVLVASDKVGAQDRGEQFGRSHRILFGDDEGSVLDGVGCDNDAVVGFGVAVFVSISTDLGDRQLTYDSSISPSIRQVTVVSTTV